MLHLGQTRVDEFASHSLRLAMLLQLHSEVRGVGGVLLVFADCGRGPVEQVHRGIILGDQGIRGIFGDPWKDLFALLEEIRKGS